MSPYYKAEEDESGEENNANDEDEFIEFALPEEYEAKASQKLESSPVPSTPKDDEGLGLSSLHHHPRPV